MMERTKLNDQIRLTVRENASMLSVVGTCKPVHPLYLVIAKAVAILIHVRLSRIV